MAALLEKMPPDYTLATCPEKPSEDTIKVRPVVPQKPEDITSRMPADWRQQLLRHIEAKRLDRVRPYPCSNTNTHTQTHADNTIKVLPVCICVSLCCKVNQICVWLHVCSIHTVALLAWPTAHSLLDMWWGNHFLKCNWVKSNHGIFLILI